MRLVEFLLLEYNKDKIIKKTGHKLLQAAQHDALYQSEISNQDEQTILNDMFNKFDEVDPTPTQKFVPWIIREYSNRRIQMSDLPALKSYLSQFVTLAPRLKNMGISTDLNQYTRHKLFDMIDQSTEPKDTKADSSIEDMLSEVDPNEMEILYKGPWGLLVKPKTEEASCILGHGTKWCTAATEYDNAFDEYQSNGYDIYIWRGKGGVAQFSFGSMEFMDKDDKPLSPEKIEYYRHENPITAKLFKREEVKLLKDPNNAYVYAKNVIEGRWPEAEPYIMRVLYIAYLYARDVIEGRWPEAEPVFLKSNKWAYRYASDVIKDRWPDAEPYIMQDPEHAYLYAKYVIHGRWPEAEPYIIKDPRGAYQYAKNVIQGRWPEAEPFIIKDSGYAYQYAKDVIQGR